MMNAYVPCPSCRRHVRSEEASCPFCAGALPSDHAARAIGLPSKRLGRGALFAFAVTVAGCGGTTEPPRGDAATDTGASDAASDTDAGNVALYGGPPDTGPEVEDTGGPMPAYGLPPDDGG